ncbi:MAG: A/G-specific adenine glycosylase [Actinomycetota bacterium]|jgi:A/G-specific adenine glycosylase|nr:A/G-specific adenine glycosylase [Actinomycetota bacterium]
MLSTVDTETIAWFRRRLKAWGRANYRSFPWRETDDPFRVLIAEVLLQRSRGKTVARVHEALFARWPDAAALSKARVPSIASVIKPLGLIRRAATLKTLAIEVVRLGEVPADLETLMALPGVGRYAASATLAVAFGRPVPTVDGVTARVYRRFFGLDDEVPASNDKELWLTVERLTPTRDVREWNWAVLDLAATVCLPKAPRCTSCPLARHCARARASI